MTNETFKAQKEADKKPYITKNMYRLAIRKVCSNYKKYLYCKYYGKKFKKLSPSELNDMLYALHHCKAYNKPLSEWFTSPWML